MSDLACGHCGAALIGRQARWCSDNCRKRAAEERHRGACIDCGATLGLGSGWRDAGRCVPCHRIFEARGKQERIEEAAAMYREGMTYRQIARELGYGSNSLPWEVTAARRQGLIGYRNRGYSNAA